MGKDNNKATSSKEKRDTEFFTERWRGATYLNFSRLGITPSELNEIEWDLYFEMVDVIEWENEKIKKVSKTQPRVMQLPELQGETERDKIMSMNVPSVRKGKSGRTQSR